MALDLDMGRYGLFVWGAWAVSALVLLALVVRAALQARTWRRRLCELERDDDGVGG